MLDPQQFITDRPKAIDASGIRRAFDLAATLKDPINLSIGQPDFDVPEPIKQRAIDAIHQGNNSYTQTQGIGPLRQRLANRLATEFPDHWADPADAQGEATLHDDLGLLVTSGVSGALVLAMLACVGPGDDVLMPDPCFVMYRHLVTLAGGNPIFIDTYPDFQLTAERVEPHITPNTKLLLANSPSNPTGIVLDAATNRQLAELCQSRNVLLFSDEIYDDFCYVKQPVADREPRCPSPASFTRDMLLARGFSKTFGMTGWRLGYIAGPRPIIEQMTKLQQYSFVCAPSMVQEAGVTALDVNMDHKIDHYRQKRDRVVERLSPYYELAVPQGAFYAFPKVPEHLNMTGSQFVEKAIEKNLLIIPGSAFSQRDTHIRLSYACDDAMLDRGLDVLVQMAQGS